MHLRAYAICSTCCEPHPSSRGCPNCDGDEISAREVKAASAIAFAADSPNRLANEHRAAVWKRRQAASIVAVLSLSLVVGTLLLVLAQS